MHNWRFLETLRPQDPLVMIDLVTWLPIFLRKRLRCESLRQYTIMAHATFYRQCISLKGRATPPSPRGLASTASRWTWRGPPPPPRPCGRRSASSSAIALRSTMPRPVRTPEEGNIVFLIILIILYFYLRRSQPQVYKLSFSSSFIRLSNNDQMMQDAHFEDVYRLHQGYPVKFNHT